jgi:predicted alpha/beta superfamily hydrolase
MKILFIALWISLLSQSIIIPQSKIEIRVISTLPSDQKVFIAGNKPELGNWNPGKISLNKINDSTWLKVFEFNIGETIEYKFTLGSWEEEALNETGKKSENNIFKFSKDTVLVFNISNWGYYQTNISGQITGNVRYHKQFKGRSVLPRDIIVWLPLSYDSLPDKYYPVLYMHDGQNVIDPLTSSFGVDWQIDEVTDSLIRAKSIQEIIIVGIYNTKERGSEYNNTELGKTYINFIIEELKPFIDTTYRSLPDCNNTSVCGSSSGGLISFIMGWEYPDVFSKSACFSPAFKISNIDYVAPVKNYTGAKKNLEIFIYNGGIGLEEQLQLGIDEMIVALKEKGFVENQDLLFIKDSFAQHNESAWAKNVYRFLEFFFPLEK